MIDPSWLADILAGLVLATALYCVGRIVVSLTRGRRVELDADLAHILMGIGMSGMLVTRLAILNATVWSVVFGLVAAWYAVRIAREGMRDSNCRRHHVGHLVSALAMLYMFLAPPATSASDSMGMRMGASSETGARMPTLALVFVLLLFAYAVLVADRIPLTVTAGGSGAPSGFGIGTGALLAPRSSALCEVVMSVAMGAMLIAML